MEGNFFLSVVNFELLSSAPKLYSEINAFILDSDVPRGIVSPKGGVLCEQWPHDQISWEISSFQYAVAQAIKPIDTFGTCTFQNHLEFAMMHYHKMCGVSLHSTLLQR